MGKPATRFFNQLKTLAPKPAAITQLETLEAAFDSANSAYAVGRGSHSSTSQLNLSRF
jgi:coatomer protein complex subunit epsilon